MLVINNEFGHFKITKNMNWSKEKKGRMDFLYSSAGHTCMQNKNLKRIRDTCLFPLFFCPPSSSQSFFHSPACLAAALPGPTLQLYRGSCSITSSTVSSASLLARSTARLRSQLARNTPSTPCKSVAITNSGKIGR